MSHNFLDTQCAEHGKSHKSAPHRTLANGSARASLFGLSDRREASHASAPPTRPSQHRLAAPRRMHCSTQPSLRLPQRMPQRTGRSMGFLSTWNGPQCKILTSAVVAHECFAALAAGSGMPRRIQADWCTATDRCRAPIEAVLSEAAGAARNRYKTLVETMRRAHRRRAGEGRAARSPSSARFESQPVSGRACPS